MPRRTLEVDWAAVDGAACKKRRLHLDKDDQDLFNCPIDLCLHTGFRSVRGLRKHINGLHGWYYYFDAQPVLRRNEIPISKGLRGKAMTHKVPAFSLTEGLGKDFVDWLQISFGGDKKEKEAIQIGRRAMKFLMTSLHESNPDLQLETDYIDICVGSPSIIIKFEMTLTQEWKLQSSGALPYMKAIRDLIDFRKCSGVTDNVLRNFTMTEVYVKRGIENFSKKKKVEYGRNLDLERLIAQNSWATIEEMDLVIPKHTERFKDIITMCTQSPDEVSRSDLTFATRYIITFLFLRVKATRPATFQYLTIDMFTKAKSNGGFIDQTEFKTKDTYVFDTVILKPEVITVIDCYVENVRPILVPKCEYLLLTCNGTQMKNLGAAFSLLVFQAIGKSLNPSRYRQVIETESSARLDQAEQEIISKDQKHSSHVAKRIYKKVLSRDVAVKGMKCMEKITGKGREEHSKELASILTQCEHGGHNFLKLKFKDIQGHSRTFFEIFKDILNQNSRTIQGHLENLAEIQGQEFTNSRTIITGPGKS